MSGHTDIGALVERARKAGQRHSRKGLPSGTIQQIAPNLTDDELEAADLLLPQTFMAAYRKGHTAATEEATDA